MDGRAFDELARSLAGSRRQALRGLLGGAVAVLGVGRGRRAAAQAATVAPGGVCLSTDECLQEAGQLTVVCGDNGIASDGALNCCRNYGGACATGNACCGVLECVGGVCTGGGTAPAPGGTVAGLPVGSPCTATSQCLASTSGSVICGSNNIEADGALNCCLLSGGQCGGFDEFCCGDLLCLGGVCTVPEFGDLEAGAICAANLDCSQAAGPTICAETGAGTSACCRLEVSNCVADADCCGDLVCGDNLIAADGTLTCCAGAGGVCGSDAACCGNNFCIDGTCQALA